MKLADANVIDFNKARQLFIKFKSRIIEGEDPLAIQEEQANSPLFRDFISETYLPWCKLNKKAFHTEKSFLKRHILPALGNKKFCDITPVHIKDLQLEILSKNKSSATVNRIIAITSAIFNFALNMKVVGLTENPVGSLKYLKEQTQRERFLNSQETSRLYRSCLESNYPTVAAFIQFLVLTGARRSEALNAQWHDIDFQNRTWYIPDTKSGKPRIVPLSSQSLSVLKSLPHESDYVFSHPLRPGKMPREFVYREWCRIRERAGLNDFRMHDLRHSFASWLVNNGRTLYEVQHILGHQSSRTTERYAHLSSSTLHDAASVAGGFFEERKK